jgi:capsular exopolysaccharide synthesis family protein
VQYTSVQNTLVQVIAGQEQVGAAAIVSEPARPASVSVSTPNRKILIPLAALGGLVLGLGLAFLFNYLSNILDTPERVEDSSSLPTVGGISFFNVAKDTPLVALVAPRSPASEDYRLLGARVNAWVRDSDGRGTVVMITSPETGDGKTTTVANLALALAMSGQSVIALDANFLRPRLDDLLGVANEKGVLDALRNGAAVQEGYLQPTLRDGLEVMTTGVVERDTPSLIASRKLASLLTNLRQRANVILIDSPALLEAADAALLAAHADATVIVVDSTRTTQEALSEAQARLLHISASTSGILLNKIHRHAAAIGARRKGNPTPGSGIE